MSVRPDSVSSRLRRLQRGLPTERIARISGLRKRSGAHNVWRGFSTLFFLVLFVLCARGYFFQQLDISGQAERVLRAQVGPQLEKQLGAKVEFGDVETDWLGRVVVHQLVVGRDSRLPTGALLQAQSVILSLDLPGIALGRAAFPAAIRSVELQKPQIYLRRDARGLNWARLLGGNNKGASNGWNGRILARDGRIFYLDNTILSASKQPLLLDARGVDARVNAQQDGLFRFEARSKTPFLGAQKLLLSAINGSGSFSSETQDGIVTLESSALPFAPLAEYVFAKREIIPRTGLNSSIGGRLVLTLARGVFAQHGALVLQNLSFAIPSQRVPGTQRALQIDALSGPFEFAGDVYSTRAARFFALGSRFDVAGAISLDAESAFDVDIQTPALPIAQLRQFLPRELSLSSAPTPLRAELSGNARGRIRRIDARGTLETLAARLALGRNAGSASVPSLGATFALAAQLRPDNSLSHWKWAARGAAPASQLTLPEGALGAQNTVLTARAAKGAGIEIGYDARAFKASSARFGRLPGRQLQILASAPDARRPIWNGNMQLDDAATKQIDLQRVSPALARTVASSGSLDLRAQFAGVTSDLNPQKIRGAATFNLASLQLNPRSFASPAALPLSDRDFSLRALRGRLNWDNGTIQVSRAAAVSSVGALRLDASVPLREPGAARFALSLPQANVDVARLSPILRAQNARLSGNWRGRVTLLSRARSVGAEASGATAPRFGIDFDLRALSSTLRGTGNRAGTVALANSRLQGNAEFGSDEGASSWSGTGILRAEGAAFGAGELGQIATIPAELTGAKARNVRIDFGLPNASSGFSSRLSARALSVPIPAVGQNRRNPVLTLQNLSADLESGRSGTQVPRFAAGLGNGELRGTARFSEAGPEIRVLMRAVDAAQIQQLLAPQSRETAQVSGKLNVALEVRPDRATTGDIRLQRGVLRVASQQGSAVFPLDGAHAAVSLSSADRLEIRDALVWSEGARIAGNAYLGKGVWNGNLDVSNARLAKLMALPMAPAPFRNARSDGLLSGNFGFTFDTRRAELSRFEGNANLKLADILGAQINSLSAQVSLQNSRRGGASSGAQLAVVGLKGEVEGATVEGDGEVDYARNAWSANLQWSGAQSARLARLQALQTASGIQSRNKVLERALPISGSFGGQLKLVGALRDERGGLAPRARDGFVRLTSGELVWRGQEFGAVQADVSIEKGVARAQTLQLARKINGISTPVVEISGTLPLEADAPGLQADVRVAPAPITFFSGILAETRDVLRNSDLDLPFLERAVSYVDALPPGTTGQVALDASLSGKWSAPRVRVSNLTLREGRTRVPAGGFSPPATLDAAFVFDNGAVTIEKAEFKIKKTNAPAKSSPLSLDSEASDEDDTLLRIEPGGSATPDGPISLAADVFNANLSQLSTWVPALRGSDGGPLLRGELSEFSFRVGGTTRDPAIIGSIQGENLALESYTLDRLRVARFEIGGGSVRIEPGNLTVVKGSFQSSAAYGRVPWSWTRPGPVLDAPIDVHFPFQTRDFGALVGAFVPALSVADADEFVGAIDVTGTLSSPALSGAITIRGGQFRLDSTRDPLAAGLREVSGTIRFIGATQLLIDPNDPLKGELVPATSVVGRVARRSEPGARNNGREVAPADAASRSVTKNEASKAPRLAGEFVLRGGVERPAQIEALLNTPFTSTDNSTLSREERQSNAARLRALLDPAAALSRLKYDLSLELNKGAFASEGFGGINDISAGMIWKTGANQAQNVRWMLAARGHSIRKKSNGGTLTSFGALALRRNFAAGIDAIARSGARDFSGESDFRDFGVARRIDVKQFPDRRAQVNFDGFSASVVGAGAGIVDGRLVLDNGASQQNLSPAAARLQNATLSVRRRRELFGPQFERDFVLTPRITEIQDEEAARIPEDEETNVDEPSGDGTPLRLGGVLSLSSAEIYGAPASGEGAPLFLSRLPGAPRFDVRLKMGRDVQVVTAAFRSGLEGDLVARGTPNNPQISGVLNTLGGQVRFPNARARVEEGRVTIAITKDQATDGLRTRLEIDATARGQAGRYAITLRLRGPLDLGEVQSGSGNGQSLQIDVTSNPPLSQSEAFQQLLGTLPDLDYDAKTGTYKTGSVNRAYTNAVLNVISAPLFSGVEQSLAQTLGLTSVGFEYRFNEPLAIQITKALGDRVFVSYRRSLGSGPTGSIASSLSSGRTPFELRIEYQLRGNYLLGLQTDERQIPSITVQKTRRF